MTMRGRWRWGDVNAGTLVPGLPLAHHQASLKLPRERRSGPGEKYLVEKEEH